jgi:broad specificity phosphatase PhoE
MPYLVRHAHAGDKRAWQGSDSLRPLSAAGRHEAHGILTQLRDYPISRILSSPALRCQQTVRPLAERRDLQVETVDALGVDAGSTGLVALLLDPAASETVLCSHGELIGEALSWLLGHDVDGERLVWPKGSTWLLEVNAGQVQHRHYLPPLRLQDVKASYY